MEKPIVKILDTSVFSDENEYQKAYISVSEERKNKVDFYRFPKDKFLSLGAGVLLREGLRQFGITEYSLRYGKNGKPYLGEYDNMFFNLSHSGVISAVAFYRTEIGVDIEKISDISKELVRKVTTKNEFSYIMGLDEEEQREQFFRLWTAKESYMKYIGTGLSLPPTDLEIDFGREISMMHLGKKVPIIFEEHTIEGYKITVCYEKGFK